MDAAEQFYLGFEPHLGPDPMPQGTDPLHQTGGAAEEGEADDDDALDAAANIVGGAVGAVGTGIALVGETWQHHQVGRRAAKAGWNVICCTVGQLRHTPHVTRHLMNGAAAGWNTLTDAAEFWVSDLCDPETHEQLRSQMDDSTLENKEGRGERQGLEKKDPQSAGSGAGDMDGNGAILDPASKSKDSPLPGSFGGSFSGSPVSSSLLIEDRARSTSPRAPDSAVDDLYLPPLALPSLLAPAVPHAPASSACTTSTTLSSQKDPPVPVQRNMFFGSMLDVLVPPEESESEPEGCSGEAT